MKINFLNKAKWYIIAFILVAIILSVSLSFCAWDNLSLKIMLDNSRAGNFETKWNDYVKDANGKTISINSLPKVGDVIIFGNYYQNLSIDGDLGEKTPIRWIVVNKDGTKLTLLSEKVLAFGSFWGTRYYKGSGFVLGANSHRYQNYSESTVRSWLNSNNARTDGGSPIDTESNYGVVFKGFLNEAFQAEEQKFITEKIISGMGGSGKENIIKNESYSTIKDKVWLPSWSEIYGTNNTVNWGIIFDGLPNAQFEYFKSTISTELNNILVSNTSAFASSKYCNYTMVGAEDKINYQSSTENSNVWWWLRSPNPNYWYDALYISEEGAGHSRSTYDSIGGVRPAINIDLR